MDRPAERRQGHSGNSQVLLLRQTCFLAKESLGASAEQPGRGDTVEAGHAHVHQHDVGMVQVGGRPQAFRREPEG